jgi:lipopolysaccharide transport system ATP-binding protein
MEITLDQTAQPVVATPPVTSNSDVVIAARNVGKMYRLYDRPQDRLKEQLFWRFGQHYGREFWALRDVSFEVRRGETVGIIGRNGSGKSTLLQIIAGTLAPTAGEIRTAGRVAALLELGSGFNFEFTGRENILLNGSILGISPEELKARYDEIVNFADIGEFIEQPVKVYSSGMLIRLAFAINALLDPDVLIIDEALAVGDEGFQRKCFAWIDSIREKGSTVLFVSHAMGTISNLCNRTILLNKGLVHLEGDTPKVVKEYHRLLFGAPPISAPANDLEPVLALASSKPTSSIFDTENLQKALAEGTQTEPIVATSAFVDMSAIATRSMGTSEKRYGHGEMTINAAGLFDKDLELIHTLTTRQPVSVILDITANTEVYDYGLGFVIEDLLGNCQFSASTQSIAKDFLPRLVPGQRLQIAFTFTSLLLKGTFFLSCGAWRVEEGSWYYYDRRVDVLKFNVYTNRRDVWGVADFGAIIGISHPQS